MGQNTETAASPNQTRKTDWIACKDAPWYPELPNGGFVAYRIWQKFDGLSWFQRHEWKAANGSQDMEDWIFGARGWCGDAQPYLEAEAA